LGEALGSLGINGPFLLAQIVNFLILFVALRVLLWKPATQRIEERRERLQQEREDAEAVAQLRAEVEAKREQMLDEAREEAQKVVAKAQQEAGTLKERMIEEASEQAEEIKDRAREDAEEERNRILGEMRGEIAALATAAAQRIIGESLDEQRQRALVNAFFSGVREGRVEVLPQGMVDIRGPVIVISAIPLTDAEEDIIREELGDRTGRDLDLTFRVNPDVLGGLIVRAGDRVIDGSVVGQLERLQESLS
jgi:F-type H+-transporting ATPase subunit b